MLLFQPSLSPLFSSIAIAIARPLAMATSHAFAGNPLKSCLNPDSLIPFLLDSSSPDRFLILPLRKGRPLARTDDSNPPRWELAWVDSTRLDRLEARGDEFVYLGSTDLAEEARQCHYWSVDVSEGTREWGDGLAFIELRTLMVATDWADANSMGQLAIAGHARALLEWHGLTKFCGSCGSKMIPISAGRRKQCTNDSCKKRIYPRVDPVVIMLVIDKENDRALLSRQSRFVPRMWSCLAGFIEPGESLEEAVRRETFEETGIEVGEVIYHSSQPWPVGSNSMPCQLMVGFFGYAKSLDIHVDKKELEDAQWHSREDVKKAITFAEYEKAQISTAVKVGQACKGVEQGPHSFSFNDYALESGEMAPMFIPGPFAIAHHLISTWVNQGVPGSGQNEKSLKRMNSVSSL
ncbi:NADH pyrophosphatase [Rhynchospora pubera]|uniref:NAD(+) diphosphatase n=1 Tax=Rhynchospora pubera TaxID=906938 RepID=A0AAV8H2G1_9POAL|nr:NADH pyrophosphatase [Rhynchospora pubera]